MKAKSPSSLNVSQAAVGCATWSTWSTSKAHGSTRSPLGCASLRVRMVGSSCCAGHVYDRGDGQSPRRWRCVLTRRSEEVTKGEARRARLVAAHTHRTQHRHLSVFCSNHCASQNSLRRCSGSWHHHFGSSSSRSDLLISSVCRRNCPGNRPTAQPSPNGRRGSRQSPGGNRSPKHS